MTLTADADVRRPFADYRPVKGCFDEYLDDQGKARPGWNDVAHTLQNLTEEELFAREALMRRVIRENGITYNVYSQDATRVRPWMLDILPLVIGSDEWSFLEKAVKQRATLFNHILRDLYGQQNLIREGHLPPYLLMANPAYLRPCVGWQAQVEHPIHLYAADLARGPDGVWWVISDRLEAASGLGYALENRLLSTRSFPGLFRKVAIERLQSFVSEFCNSYERLSPRKQENPRVVLLTPGAAHETYYEQSYLARNLGYPLVEGEDLMVREGKVYLKTVNGAQQVDVIIRRVDASWCDPLELRNDSLLGVPGLVDALRQGRVAVANSLGAGVLETSALPAFLPGLSRHLLNEELLFPSVATWWCGQPRECQYVLDHLDQLVIKPTFRMGHTQALFGPSLSPESLQRLKQRIQAHPEDYSAQEIVQQGTTPVFIDGKISPRSFLLRVYLVPGEDGTWRMMPGGLARVAPAAETNVVSMQHGGESKDVWVVAKGPDSGNRPTIRVSSVSNNRQERFDLPSRAAENLFWLGRYAERTEQLSRVLRVLILNLMEEGDEAHNQALGPLLSYTLSGVDLEKWQTLSKRAWTLDDVSPLLSRKLRDQRNPESLASNFRSLQRSASLVKERLSIQLWQQLQRTGELVGIASAQRPAFDGETLMLLEESLALMASLSGLITENMTRGQAWLFLDLGRRLERAVVTLNLLESTLGQTHPQEDEVLRRLLDCTDSGMTYRRRHLTHMRTDYVLDLLLQDDANPRSLAFQTAEIQKQLGILNQFQSYEATERLTKAALKAYSTVRLAAVGELVQPSPESKPASPATHPASATTKPRPQLVEWLQRLTNEFLDISNELARQYFVHTADRSRFVAPGIADLNRLH